MGFSPFQLVIEPFSGRFVGAPLSSLETKPQQLFHDEPFCLLIAKFVRKGVVAGYTPSRLINPVTRRDGPAAQELPKEPDEGNAPTAIRSHPGDA